MQGVVDQAHWVVLAVVLASVLHTPRGWRAVLQANLAAGAAMACIVLARALDIGVPYFGALPELSPTRLGGPFGNSSYLSIYMLVNLVLAAGFAARAWAWGGALGVLVRAARRAPPPERAVMPTSWVAPHPCIRGGSPRWQASGTCRRRSAEQAPEDGRPASTVALPQQAQDRLQRHQPILRCRGLAGMQAPWRGAAFLAYVSMGARRSVREAARQHHSSRRNLRCRGHDRVDVDGLVGSAQVGEP